MCLISRYNYWHNPIYCTTPAACCAQEHRQQITMAEHSKCHTYIVYLHIYIVQEMCSKFWPEEHDSPAVYSALLVHRVGTAQEPDWDEIQLEVLGKNKVLIA